VKHDTKMDLAVIAMAVFYLAVFGMIVTWFKLW
jgi:hypothetical protein